MLTLLQYCAVAAIVCAIIERIRIAVRWGKTPNVKHAISGTIAVLVAVPTYYMLHRFTFGWHTVFFAAVFTCCRGLFYDPALNLLQRKKIDAISQTTSSGIDQRLTRVQFWKRRAIYAGLLVIILLINYFL